MGFMDWSNIAFFAGVKALFVGFVMYFLLMLYSRHANVSNRWRLCLTFVAISAVMSSQIYHLVVPPDIVWELSDPAMSSEGLWLAIKVKFCAGLVGHISGYVVEKWLE
ncbi:hypothetical protein [Duganella sacchari]|uniref:hypothetical protein n=1 Tax=Duganella sacchari TaxID=551987 RepID=UPI0009350CE1|nr:hypothetical protein [Duganella sacchari]